MGNHKKEYPRVNKTEKILLISEAHFGKSIRELVYPNYNISFIPIDNWRSMDFLSKMLLLQKHNIIHHFGGTFSKTLINGCKALRKKLIIHFIGTDVYHIIKSNRNEINSIRKLYSNAWKLAAVGENLVEELNSVGIDKVEYVPFAAGITEPSDYNKQPENSALVYLPQGKEDFYGAKEIKGIIQNFPAVRFYILANEGYDNLKVDNVKFSGWIDNVGDYLNKVKIYLRYTVHDGVPNMVLEALLYGRQVLYNHSFPYCRNFTLKDFEKALTEWQFNKKGREYVAINYSPQKIAENFLKLYSDPK